MACWLLGPFRRACSAPSYPLNVLIRDRLKDQQINFSECRFQNLKGLLETSSLTIFYKEVNDF